MIKVKMRHIGDDEFNFWLPNSGHAFFIYYLVSLGGVQIRSDLSCLKSVYQIAKALEQLLERYEHMSRVPLNSDNTFYIEID